MIVFKEFVLNGGISLSACIPQYIKAICCNVWMWILLQVRVGEKRTHFFGFAHTCKSCMFQKIRCRDKCVFFVCYFPMGLCFKLRLQLVLAVCRVLIDLFLVDNHGHGEVKTAHSLQGQYEHLERGRGGQGSQLVLPHPQPIPFCLSSSFCTLHSTTYPNSGMSGHVKGTD